MKNKLDKTLSKLLIILMATMVVNVLWQVFSRYILGSPSPYTEELARFLMIWLGLFGAAFISGKDAHVAINILPQNLSGKMQKKMTMIVTVLIILFAISVMVIGGFRLVYITWTLRQSSPALGIPLAIVYFALPLSGILVIFYKADKHLRI